MHVIVARYEVKPGRADEVEALLRGMIPHALSEPGCRQYAVNRSLDDPSVFLLYEQYDDADAFAAHGATEAVQRIVIGQIRPLLANRVLETYAAIQPNR